MLQGPGEGLRWRESNPTQRMPAQAIINPKDERLLFLGLDAGFDVVNGWV